MNQLLGSIPLLLLLVFFFFFGISVVNSYPAKIKLFRPPVNTTKVISPKEELPFGKRLPTSAELRVQIVKGYSAETVPPFIIRPRTTVEKPNKTSKKDKGRGLLSKQGASLFAEPANNEEELEFDLNGEFIPGITEAPDTQPCHQSTITERRFCEQSKEFDRLINAGLEEPNEIKTISANDSIYAHVRWFDNYMIDTEIWNGSRMIPFKYDFFGSCLPKTTDPEKSFSGFRSSDEVVEYYTVLMKEYCHSDLVKVYKRLTNLGYLQIAPIGRMKYLSVVKNNSLVSMKKLSIDDLSSLVRLFKIAAYSEIFTSMVLHPGQAIDPMLRPLSYRCFILINTALHMLDLVVQYSSHHYTVLVRLMYRRMLIMGREVYCRYTMNTEDIGQKQRRKNDAVATTILMEYLSKCATNPQDCINEDAHDGFMNLYLDEELGLHAKYKEKVGELTKRPSFHHVCTLIFPFLD